MNEKTSPSNNVHKIYSHIVILALCAHITFAVAFIFLKIYPIMIYNFFSIAFYVFLYITLKPKLYPLAVAAVHLEVSLFAIITTIYFGWTPGYSFYLIALCSLVYFCPYRNVYIPYYFSFGEAIVFLILKLYSVSNEPIAPISSEFAAHLIYCYNAIACLGVILYAAYTSNLSAVFAKRELLEMNENLQDLLHHDALTQLYTRNYLEEKFNAALSQSKSVTLSMVDIDNFKHINDTYGHPCGDYVLFTVSTIMKTVCPSGTDISRWGGEEFVLLFYDYTKEEVLESIQNLRKAIADYAFQFSGNAFHITATFGVSFIDEHTEFLKLVEHADQRMYFGKRAGKNRVISFD